MEKVASKMTDVGNELNKSAMGFCENIDSEVEEEGDGR